jgi:hypothetical protein
MIDTPTYREIGLSRDGHVATVEMHRRQRVAISDSSER